MASMLSQEEDPASACPPGLHPLLFQDIRMQLAKWKREVSCAMNLVDLLEPFVTGGCDEAEFRRKIEELGAELSATKVGGALLRVIGYCYEERATSALGSMNVSGGLGERVLGANAYLQHKAHTMRNYASVASATVSAARAVKDAPADGADADAGAGDQKAIFQVMWHSTVIEIEALLQRVVKKVTHDTSVEKELRQKRAHALIIAGKVFWSLGTTTQDGLQDLTQ